MYNAWNPEKDGEHQIDDKRRTNLLILQINSQRRQNETEYY